MKSCIKIFKDPQLWNFFKDFSTWEVPVRQLGNMSGILAQQFPVLFLKPYKNIQTQRKYSNIMTNILEAKKIVQILP